MVTLVFFLMLCRLVNIMGRHSIKRKQVQRKKQKKKKRRRQPPGVIDDSTVYGCESDTPTCTSELSNELDDSQMNSSHGSMSSSEFLPHELLAKPHPKDREDTDNGSTCDNALFAALDRVGEDSDTYWNKVAEEKITEFDSYHDAHPCIVEDEQRSIKVYVVGSGPYKGRAGLKRVAMEEYIGRIMKKEAKATDLCRAMRDRIEKLEDALKDSKVKMIKLHRENQRKVEKVRYFWRNKIYEGNSRGGELLRQH